MNNVFRNCHTDFFHVDLGHIEVVTFEDIDELESQGGDIVTNLRYVILGHCKFFQFLLLGRDVSSY